MRKYLQLLRVNHWFKNLFIFAGVLLARPSLDAWLAASLAFLLASTISSVNYIVNQIADRKFDALHPEKKYRPLPSGQITLPTAKLLALVLLIFSLVLAKTVFSTQFFVTLVALWLAGIFYNIKPIRLKDIPYIDVLSESFNNPLRFLIGWFCVTISKPSVEVLLLTWSVGAVFMTAKRYDELVFYGKKLGPYRATFDTYTADRLLGMMVVYAAVSEALLLHLAPWTAILGLLFFGWFVHQVISGQAKARDIESFVLHPFRHHLS